MANDVRLYKKIRCTFCLGTDEYAVYTTCPYCNQTRIEYVEASIKSIAEYCNDYLTPQEQQKLKELLNK